MYDDDVERTILIVSEQFANLPASLFYEIRLCASHLIRVLCIDLFQSLRFRSIRQSKALDCFTSNSYLKWLFLCLISMYVKISAQTHQRIGQHKFVCCFAYYSLLSLHFCQDQRPKTLEHHKFPSDVLCTFYFHPAKMWHTVWPFILDYLDHVESLVVKFGWIAKHVRRGIMQNARNATPERVIRTKSEQ